MNAGRHFIVEKCSNTIVKFTTTHDFGVILCMLHNLYKRREILACINDGCEVSLKNVVVGNLLINNISNSRIFSG